MTSKEWRQHCLENKLCVVCHQPNDTDNQMCTKCADKHKERMKDRREFYLRAGICPVCGINELAGNERTCPECLAAKAERIKQRDKKKLYYYTLERRKRLKQNGLCVLCGKLVETPGHATCQACRERRRNEYADKHEIKRNQRISKGQCYICGSEDLVDGKKLCKLCYKRSLKRADEMHKARKGKKKNND